MTDSTGCGFACSRAGFWKLLVLITGGACWALYIASGKYTESNIKVYILIAYMISWIVSLMTYFIKITGLYLHIQSECLPFCTFDYFWSWLSSLNFIACSVLLSCFFGGSNAFCNGNGRFCQGAMQLTALLLGFLTAIFYILEAQNLKNYAPVGGGYGTTWRGMYKIAILATGAVAFGLLVNDRGCGKGCSIARTFTFAVWCIVWGVVALMYLLRIITCTARISPRGQSGFGAFEFFWSVFGCFLFIVGGAVFAAFLQCSSNQFSRNGRCRRRLVSLICGFVTAVLLAIDAFYMRDKRPVCLGSRQVTTTRSTSGGREVTTTTTTRRVTST